MRPIISLFLLFVLIAISYGAEVEEKKWKILDKKWVWADCHFNEEAEGETVKTNKDCAKKCDDSKNGCTHWTYSEEKDGKKTLKKCYTFNLRDIKLEDAVAGKKEDKDVRKQNCGFSSNECSSVIMCQKKPVAEWEFDEKKEIKLAAGCAFRGKPLKLVSNSKNDCESQCAKQKNPKCTHWTWKNKKCSLFKGTPTTLNAFMDTKKPDAKKQTCGFLKSECTSKDACEEPAEPDEDN